MTISKSKLWNSFDQFTKAYIEALLWQAGEDEQGESIDRNYDQFSLTIESLQRIKKDCEKFQKLAGDLILTEGNCLRGTGEYSQLEQAGHDFCLTRNRHGAGFWETTDWEKQAGKKLTELSYTFPEDNVFPRNKRVLDAISM